MKKRKKEDIETLIEGIWSGRYTPIKLPATLFEYTADNLEQSIEIGYYGKKRTIQNAIETVLIPDDELVAMLKNNTFFFAANKTAQQLKDMNKLLFDDAGNRVSKAVFVENALKVDKLYNKHYLKTEYNTSTRLARSGREWKRIEESKDIYPYLGFVSVDDGNTRASHRELDGITRKVDDPFWNTHMPPLDWNCRCRIRRKMAEDATETPIPKDAPKRDDVFPDNVYKSREIWTKKHPYNKGLSKVEALAARKLAETKTIKPK